MNLDQETYNASITPMQSHVNVGSGEDITIKELALIITKVIGYEGSIEFDPTKPDGTPGKLMDSTRLNNLCWHASVSLETGQRRFFEKPYMSDVIFFLFIFLYFVAMITYNFEKMLNDAHERSNYH